MDNSSNTTELGDILVHDLATVLDQDFGYEGSFAYSENRPDAPNPFLAITDVGLISLPLSEIDAKRLIASSTEALFGFEMPTIIEPSLVSFQNSAWDSFLQSNIANISSGLGLSGGYDIRYKLHKLLIYETAWDSHFHSHQDTQEEDGVFATMVIFLPSQHTGGEIVLSHGSTSEVIDVSASCTSISVLSWYIDVKHRVKFITSGYRLALSYHLIRRSLSGPEVVSTADNASELCRLHEILERWRTGGYKELPRQRMVALVLGHLYSKSDLDIGQAALKGQDAHKVNQICSVAQMLGFELWLAKSQYCYHPQREVEAETDYDSDGQALEYMPLSIPLAGRYLLEYFTDLKGSRVLGKIEYFDARGLFMGDLERSKFNVRYNKNVNNVPDNLKYVYHRAVLVIFHKEDMDRVMIIARGANYGLDKLQGSLNQDKPTPENRKIVDLLLEYNKMNASMWKTMAQFALRWHDLDLWNRIIKRSMKGLSSFRLLITLKEELFFAWDVFGFQQIQSSYEIIFSSERPRNRQKIEFIHEVKARAASLDEQEVVEAWCSEQIVAFVKGFRPNIGRQKLLISIAKEDGIRFLKYFKGRGRRWNNNNYHAHIIKLFISEKQSIYASPPNQPGSNNEDLHQIFEDFLDKCFQGVLDKGSFLPSNETIFYSQASKINHVLEVVELYIATNRVDECATLFRLIWDANGDALKKLTLYYIPLTLHLRIHLQKLGATLLLPPFATFARNVIRYYLSQLLGSKTHNPRPSPQTLPCNQSCKTCANLREFLEQSYVPVRDFYVSRKTRKHSFIVLRRLRNFISIIEVTRGRYRVAKHRKFLNSNRWEYRLEKARNLLKSIGDDDFIEQLMGDRFEDLKAALEGKSSYNYTGPLPRHKQQPEKYPAYVTEDDSDTEDETEDEMEDEMQ